MAEEPEATKPLVGEIETQFIFRPSETDIVHARAAVLADQEMVCGYKLYMVKERSMELADAHGPYVEVFVTFAPVPTVTEAQMALDPTLRPPGQGDLSVPPEDGSRAYAALRDGTQL